MPKSQKKSPLFEEIGSGEEYSALEDLPSRLEKGEDGVPMLSLNTCRLGSKNPSQIYIPTTIKMKKVTIKDKIRKVMPYFLLLQFMLFLYLLFVYFNYQGILPMFFKNETETETTTSYINYNTTPLNNTRIPGSNPLLILKDSDEDSSDTVSYGDTSNEGHDEVTDPIIRPIIRPQYSIPIIRPIIRPQYSIPVTTPTTAKQEVFESGEEIEEVTDSIKIPITMPTTTATTASPATSTISPTFTEFVSSTEKEENSMDALDVEFENTFNISQQNISNIVLN